MKEIEKNILKIIKDLSNNDVQKYVAVSSIDRRVLLIDSSIIYSNELIQLLDKFVNLKYLQWKNENKSSISFTKEGLEMYKG